jgi:hypothetical protein
MQGSRSHGGGDSGSAQSANSWRCRENLPATAELFCYCGIPAPVKISRTPKNNGRRFCSCENFKVCTEFCSCEINYLGLGIVLGDGWFSGINFMYWGMNFDELYFDRNNFTIAAVHFLPLLFH